MAVHPATDRGPLRVVLGGAGDLERGAGADGGLGEEVDLVMAYIVQKFLMGWGLLCALRALWAVVLALLEKALDKAEK